jgi:lambda repressor-like predicted transcriptional regulator
MLSQTTKIKIELLKKGIFMAEIARREGVTRAAICMTVKNEIKSIRLRRAIAQALGMKVEDLWPENKRKAA